MHWGLLLIAALLGSSGNAHAQCTLAHTIYTLQEDPSWELTVFLRYDDWPHTGDVPGAHLKHTKTGKTYPFSWSVSNGIGAMYLLPLPAKQSDKSLRAYTLVRGQLQNGLPDAGAPAAEGLFIEGLDAHVRYADIDQLELPVGFWKPARCN